MAEIKSIKKAARAFYIILALSIFYMSVSAPCSAGARFSGTIISVDASSGSLVLQLGDKSKKKIVMEKNATFKKGGGGGSLGSFRAGEQVVASICSALNDDPLRSDSLMDNLVAKQTAPVAYTIPSNSGVGSYATTGGPGATGGTSPNVIASIAQGGGANFTPPNVVNAPFTASPAVTNSPYAGQVIANPSGLDPQGRPLNGYQNIQTGQNAYTASPAPLNSPQTGQALTSGGGPPPSSAGSMITGQQNTQASPINMMLDHQEAPAKAADPYGGNNPALIMGDKEEDDDDENHVSMFNNPDQQGSATGPCQLNARVMDINYTSNVVFYMILGSQDLGSAVITSRTQLVDGQTRQPLTLKTLPRGCIVVVNGIQKGGGSVEATSIVVMKRL